MLKEHKGLRCWGHNVEMVKKQLKAIRHQITAQWFKKSLERTVQSSAMMITLATLQTDLPLTYFIGSALHCVEAKIDFLAR